MTEVDEVTESPEPVPPAPEPEPAAPDEAPAVAKIACPVYGFYGENDARVGATIPKAESLMKAAGKVYEPVTYAGAGHGFMREGEAPDAKPANKKARDDAWARWKKLFAALDK